MSTPAAILPELVLLAGALAVFVIALQPTDGRRAGQVALATSILATLASLWTLGGASLTLFDGALRVDALSQGLKVVFGAGLSLVLLLHGRLPDIREDVKGEYHLFLLLSVVGFHLLASSVELVTLVVALELSSFPLFLAVALRREREGHRNQLESAIKYVMFGVAANGIMFFGLGYLYGLTGTTSLPLMAERLRPVMATPLAVAGLLLSLAAVWYKLAVFPFHFWTPDVYQGASNETAGLVASLPKLGAVLVFHRFMALAAPDSRVIPLVLGGLAVASMLYGNLIALAQTDLKRLLGFSGIAHAGYAVLGFVAMDSAGTVAAFYYLTAYILMVLGCFTVISRVSVDGANLGITELAGLHRRSPWLAVTLLAGMFGLAGIPPFAGFMGKLALFTAALKQGHLILVILAVLNAAVAIYYYLSVIREAFFRDAGDRPPIPLDLPSRILCGLLVAGILGLGILPGPVFEFLGRALGATPGG